MMMARAGADVDDPAADLKECFQVLEDCDDVCIVARTAPQCRHHHAGEFYPELTLAQGGVQSSVIGRPYSIDGRPGHRFVLPIRGFEAGRPANLTIVLYFYNVVDLYGELPVFRSAQPSRLNQVVYQSVYVYNIKPSDYVRTGSDQAARKHEVEPVVFDQTTYRAVDDTFEHAADGAYARSSSSSSASDSRDNSSLAWIHLVGDSVMRAHYVRLCASCSNNKDVFALIKGAGRHESTCFCREKNLIFHYDEAWLDWTPHLNHTGAKLSDLHSAGNADFSVDQRALVTVLSLGSHSPQYSAESLRRAVPAFVERFVQLTSDKLAILLTTAVCIDKIPSHQLYTKGTWEYLLRNNYRIRELNEVILRTSARLHVPAVDLFSWSLSAGCKNYVDAVHMSSELHGAFAEAISRLWAHT